MSVDQSIRPSRLLLFGFHICSLTVKQQIERQNMVLWLLTSSVSLLWPVVGGKKSCYTITDHHHHLHTAIPIPSQYIFSILVFINGNSDLFQLNSEIHDLNTRYNCNLHLSSTLPNGNWSRMAYHKAHSLDPYCSYYILTTYQRQSLAIIT